MVGGRFRIYILWNLEQGFGQSTSGGRLLKFLQSQVTTDSLPPDNIDVVIYLSFRGTVTWQSLSHVLLGCFTEESSSSSRHNNKTAIGSRTVMIVQCTVAHCLSGSLAH